MRLYKNIEIPISLVERSGTSFYSRVFLYESGKPLRSTTSPKDRKDIARGEAPGKRNNITSPEGATEKDAQYGRDIDYF